MQKVPHCDSAILHSPGVCQYCDNHPDWQELRELWRINFSDTNDPDKAPCPSTLTRTAETRDRWGGNRPVPAQYGPVVVHAVRAEGPTSEVFAGPFHSDEALQVWLRQNRTPAWTHIQIAPLEDPDGNHGS